MLKGAPLEQRPAKKRYLLDISMSYLRAAEDLSAICAHDLCVHYHLAGPAPKLEKHLMDSKVRISL